MTPTTTPINTHEIATMNLKDCTQALIMGTNMRNSLKPEALEDFDARMELIQARYNAILATPKAVANFYRTKKQVGTRMYFMCVSEYGDTMRGEVSYRPINAKTGKPWQAERTVFKAESDIAPAEALKVWLKLGLGE